MPALPIRRMARGRLMVGQKGESMWAFLTKAELFDGLKTQPEQSDLQHLKYLQDTWVHGVLRAETATRVIEIGGGASRTLPPLRKRGIECWNADKLAGFANGPLADTPGIRLLESSGVKIVRTFIGEFSPELPDSYFDVAYSISVLEHLDDQQLHDCFKDTARILKPGGRVYHAVDLFLGSQPLKRTSEQIGHLRRAAEAAGLEPLGDDRVGPEPVFSTAYASPSDVYLARKWCFTPQLRDLVKNYALTSLLMGHRRPL